MRATRLTSSLTCVAASVVLGFASAPGAAAAVTMPTFYTPPASLPSGDGSLIRTEKMTTLLNVYGTATRIMYTSTDSTGARVAVTGTYVEPWAKWSGSGPRPVVSFSVGTVGQGDGCAPSHTMPTAVAVTGASFGLNYEVNNINNLLAKGVAVVVTDYIGLGTPDRVHTYMNRVDQAHAVLDAARVASKVPGSTVTAESKVATYGYSQGGGASGAAVELAPQYAPELNLAGAYVGAPPADLKETLKGVDGSSIVSVAAYFTNGLVSEHPEITATLDAKISDKGRTTLTTASTQCIADSIFAQGFHKTSEWTTDGESLSQVLAADPALTRLVDEQRIGRLRPAVPVRVATGTTDDIVPHAQAKQLALDWCAKGANITYVPVKELNWGTKVGTNHVAPMVTDAVAARDWIVGLLSGNSVAGNCATAPSMS